MENKVLSILIIDDSPDDAELPVKELRAAGYRLKTERVYNLAGMEAALQKDPWDLVLSDYTLLQFSAQMALEVLKRKHLDIPLIVITRSISDADLYTVTDAGARDVVRKNYTGRLVPAIRRELKVAEMRRELEATRKKIAEMATQHSAMVTGTQEAVCYCHEGMHIEANQAYLDMFGYDSLEDLEVIPVLNLIAKNDQKKFKDALRKAAKGAKLESGLELDAVKQGGDPLRVEAVFAPVKLNGEDTIQLTFTDISARKATEDRLQYLTQCDALTGLFNRHYFTKELNHALNAAKKEGKSSALVYFDLYQLEEINNSLGYTVGDGMLLKITKLMRDRLGDNGMLARFGDEELTILLADSDGAKADALAEELKQALDDANLGAGNRQYPFGCAIGTSEITADMKSIHEAISRAVIKSKEQRPVTKKPGPPPTEAVTPLKEPPAPAEIPPTAAAPVETAAEPAAIPEAEAATGTGDPLITAALNSNGFRLVFQPIVSMQGETEEMYEVLVRMAGDNGELIPPGQFMPKAEASGQIVDIDCWVIQRTLESMAAMSEQGRAVSYFVNISPSSLNNPELLPTIEKAVKAAKIEARRLIIELPHPAVTQNMDTASKFISELRELGCLISLDNSGPVTDTLLKLPRQSIKFLKFDGNGVIELAGSGDQETLTAVLEMAKQLAIRTVATHIEDAAALSEIWPYGFDYVQGHYFQQPDSDLSYEFAADDETTLSEAELATPTWSQ